MFCKNHPRLSEVYGFLVIRKHKQSVCISSPAPIIAATQREKVYSTGLQGPFFTHWSLWQYSRLITQTSTNCVSPPPPRTAAAQREKFTMLFHQDHFYSQAFMTVYSIHILLKHQQSV